MKNFMLLVLRKILTPVPKEPDHKCFNGYWPEVLPGGSIGWRPCNTCWNKRSRNG